MKEFDENGTPSQPVEPPAPDERKHDRGHRISGRYHMYKGDARTAFTRGALVIVALLLQFTVMLLSSLLVLRYAVLIYAL